MKILSQHIIFLPEVDHPHGPHLSKVYVDGLALNFLFVSGQLLRTIHTGEDKPKSHIFSLAVNDDDTLVVPRYAVKVVYFYELLPY